MKRIADILAAGRALSFEFFPPSDDDMQRRLEKTLEELAELAPSFVSVTCGAGGQGHGRTQEIVVDICRGRDFPAMAHLTCVGHSRSEIARLLDVYAENDVLNILALAGDPPADGSTAAGDFRYAIELVEMIQQHPANFSVGVAAHPEVHPRSENRAMDRRRLAEKLEAADFAVTQFFFDPAVYVALVNELADLGTTKPVIPGVQPVTGPKSVRRYAAMNGSAVPEELFARLEAMDPDDRTAAAADAATELARALLDAGAPGIHIYTLNRPEASRLIHAQLSL